MNNIITLRRLVEILSSTANIDPSSADDFIAAFTNTIKEALRQGESVKVKGIGTFAIDESQKISFTPDNELAEAINEPFSMFVPEELDPDLALDDLKKSLNEIEAEENQLETSTVTDSNNEIEIIQNPTESATETVDETIETQHIIEPPVYQQNIVEPEKEQEKEPELVTELVSEPITEPVTESESEEIDNDDEEETLNQNSKDMDYNVSKFWVAWGAAIGLLVGLAIGFFVHDPIERFLEPSLADEYDEYYEEPEDDTVAQIQEDIILDSETPAENTDESKQNTDATTSVNQNVETSPNTLENGSNEDVYDTIREGNSLGTMARKHYGANVYWVYIYMENKTAISNPNKVAIGTKLKIPPLKKYATLPTESENREAAQKKANEILSKFQK